MGGTPTTEDMGVHRARRDAKRSARHADGRQALDRDVAEDELHQILMQVHAFVRDARGETPA